TCLPGFGHFYPMVPLGTALVAAGHEVVFATAEEFCPHVEEMGFGSFPAGISLASQLEQAGATIPEAAMPPGKERFTAFVPRMLGGVAAPPRARDLLPFLKDWRPDLVVHEETELGGPLAAAAAGILWADQAVGILRPLAMACLAGDTLAPLAEEWGVDLGPWAGLFRYLYLDVCPPSLQSAEIAQINVAHLMSNLTTDAAGEGLPEWIDALDGGRPTVYVSLGTIFNQDPGVFATVLAALSDEHLNLIVTLGPGSDPAVLGPQPDHVHVEAFIPQDLILPRCDVVINQGGTAILSILGHGRPVLVLPQGANQFHNAEACVASGAGRRLLPDQFDAASVRTEVLRLLDEPSYGEAAARLAGEMAAMPGPAQGVALLEQLVRERVPLLASR
ncbi:MAG: glycosyltransferase, partial [Actinomycetota bacterium]|nr:glycosyltransferase [Actinomycetota bacterium]